ncbi:hypothetical protein M9435_006887 [Picochlorum sp. BPE23]|nr:hypothetical protein M9435_006887 [Picochlorum sp. BPE23]
MKTPWHVSVSSDCVRTSPSRFIDITDGDLEEYCIGILSDYPAKDIKLIYSLGQAICSAKNSELKIGLEQDFEYFARAYDGLEMPKHLKSLSEDDIRAREERFLSNMMTVLMKNHYHILTEQEWEAAAAEDFLLTLPVNVKWDSMDDSLLHRTVWKSFPEMRDAYPACLRNRILIFHRGVTCAKMEGKYFAQKVEMLISFLVIQPILRLLLWTLDRLGLRKIERLNANVENSSSLYMRQSSLEGTTDLIQVQGDDHAASICIDRRTFHHIFPDARSVLQLMFKTIQLQEACWKDVVVVYRMANTSGTRHEFDIKSSMADDAIERNIVLKRFSSIPIADMEIVFPEKNIHMPPSVLVNIAVTLLGAILTLIATIRGGLSLTSFWTTLTMLGTRLGQVLQTKRSQKSEIERSMSQLLSQRTVASQNAALSSIINDMFSQLVRQVVFAYFVLVKHHGSTMAQLDERCEHILKQTFDLSIDFTCQEAIQVLKKWGIVTEDPTGRLLPLEIEECKIKLTDVLVASSAQQRSTIQETLKGLGLQFGSTVKESTSYSVRAIDDIRKSSVQAIHGIVGSRSKKPAESESTPWGHGADQSTKDQSQKNSIKSFFMRRRRKY